MKLSEEKIKGQKLFANKIWNITRFILSNIEGMYMSVSYTPRDQELLSEWKTELTKITQDIEEYSLHTASESIYHYIWDTLASTILEESKPLLISEDVEAKQSRQKLLYTLLTESITVLHPFMPFVTETIWQILPYKDKDLLMISKWPGV
jgi:valyl-tRNA synthetase